MKTSEFTKKYYIDRKNTDSIKWDNPEVKNKLPMFIADMDFKCDEKIINPLKERIKHGAYGYSFLPKDYYDVLIKWNKDQNNITLKKEWIRFSKGAVDGIFQVLHALTKEKDSILITTPVYPPFKSSILTSKRKVVISKLKRKNNLYTFDYKDIEKKIINNKVKMMILCSPHNPLGRVWKKEELNNLFKILHKHHVIILSDEVHSDLIMPAHKFIPSLSLKEYQDDIITLFAASKTFSLALYSHCHVVIKNEKLRNKFDAYQKENHLDSVNILNAYPTYYGYKYCKNWVNDLNNVIYENYEYIVNRLSKYVDILKLEGTYLLFINFNKYTNNAYKFLYDKCDIVTNDGETFAKGYASWARFNIATSLDNIKKACDRIEKELNKIKRR